MDKVIEIQNIVKNYQIGSVVVRALRSVTVDIRRNEYVAIMGPSGSGKSTLAHCINGLVPFSYSGEITGSYKIKGQDPAKLGIFGLSKLVGTVLQDTDGQFIGLTVAEDIAFVLENDKVALSEMKVRVDEVAETVEVDQLLKHAPGELSGGQKQRVSMAGVMIDDVDILLFDEPLANLDPATGKRAIDLIDKIQKQRNATILIIEHRLEDALYRDVDRIIVIGEGRIIADEKPDKLLTMGVLREQGIREPLYLTALKNADCIIKEETKPQHIESMNLEPYIHNLQNWFQTVRVPEKEKNEESVLKIHNLNFSYLEGQPILQNIDFTVNKKEMVSIVGKNGAGKTTLSSLICGFINPNSGTIQLNGQDISSLSIKERGEKIGLVMQNPNQMISKPMIFDEVAFGLQARGVDPEEIKTRVNQTLQTCGLYPFRNWPISALSFGQKKRVTIASILVMNPEIIILDEPTAGQDYRHYTEIMEFLKRINENYDITIIMITHDMHLMLEYTDRAIVLSDGQMIADDLPSRILTNDEIADRAYLKKTSLYDLSVKCGIENPSDFVESFIYYERKTREVSVCQES